MKHTQLTKQYTHTHTPPIPPICCHCVLSVLQTRWYWEVTMASCECSTLSHRKQSQGRVAIRQRTWFWSKPFSSPSYRWKLGNFPREWLFFWCWCFVVKRCVLGGRRGVEHLKTIVSQFPNRSQCCWIEWWPWVFRFFIICLSFFFPCNCCLCLTYFSLSYHSFPLPVVCSLFLMLWTCWVLPLNMSVHFSAEDRKIKFLPFFIPGSWACTAYQVRPRVFWCCGIGELYFAGVIVNLFSAVATSVCTTVALGLLSSVYPVKYSASYIL